MKQNVKSGKICRNPTSKCDNFSPAGLDSGKEQEVARKATTANKATRS